AKLQDEPIDLILGPVFSRDSKAIQPLAAASDINMISFSNDSSLLEHDKLFLLGNMPEQSITHALDYAMRNGYDNVYAIIPRTKYGDIALSALQYSRKQLGFNLRHVERYMPTKTGNISDPVEIAMVIRKIILDNHQRLIYGGNDIIPPRHLILIPEGGI